MKDKTLILSQLNQFLARNFFSVRILEKRGLLRLKGDRSLLLKQFFRVIAEDLAKVVIVDGNPEEMHEILIEPFKVLANKLGFEKGEREYIAEIYGKLADIVQIDIQDAMDDYVEHSLVSTRSAADRPTRIEGGFYFVTKPCTLCGLRLEIKSLAGNAGKPGDHWVIVRCSQCSELNILDPGLASGGFGLINCGFEDRLAKNEYTFEQALIKLQELSLSQSGN